MVTCRLKHPPQNEREERLRCTLISSISQKLERMDTSDLKELHFVATKLLQYKKDFNHKADT